MASQCRYPSGPISPMNPIRLSVRASATSGMPRPGPPGSALESIAQEWVDALKDGVLPPNSHSLGDFDVLLVHVLADSIRFLFARLTAKLCPQPGAQHGEVAGLGHVIVRPGIEAVEDGLAVFPAGQHDHRNRPPLGRVLERGGTPPARSCRASACPAGCSPLCAIGAAPKPAVRTRP